MATLFHTTNDDLDRIYLYLYRRRGSDRADAVLEQIREDTVTVGVERHAQRFGLKYHRGRNGYFFFFEWYEGEANIYAIFHQYEQYAELVSDRAVDFWKQIAD